MLERDGFARRSHAEDGVEAVQTVFRTQPDAVILDVQMPRVSGYVAARVLKDDWQTADIPVILLTSLDAATDRYWGALVGADRFLSKDFEAPQLVAAVREVDRSTRTSARGGRARLVPDPVELGDDDVYARIGDLLDRKLFEAQVHAEVTSIASEVFGFEETVAAVLTVLGRVVDYDLAAVLMLDDRSTYVTLARDTSHQQYAEFFAAIAGAAGQVTGQSVDVGDLVPRVADPDGMLGAEDEGGMATFLSMPLKARGRIVGVLGLSSATKNAFGETVAEHAAAGRVAGRARHRERPAVRARPGLSARIRPLRRIGSSACRRTERPSSADFRAAASQFATGITVVTTVLDGVDHAMTVNSFTSVSLDPLLVLVCAERSTRFHDAVLGSRPVGGLGAARDGAGVGGVAGHQGPPAGRAAGPGAARTRPADRGGAAAGLAVRVRVRDVRRARRRRPHDRGRQGHGHRASTTGSPAP